MSVRRTSQSLHSSLAQRTCSKHPERLATHQLAYKGTHNDAYYCEKCSIMLASQGYNVLKLTAFTPVSIKKGSMSSRNSKGSTSRQYSILSNRKNQITMFIDNLEVLNFQLNRKIETIQDFLIRSQKQHGKMIEQANRYYSQIQQIIELQKYTTYNSILSKRSLQQSKARSTRDGAIQASQQIQAMIIDIKQNMDAVQTVDYSIYNAIMGGYQAKTQKLKQISKQPLCLNTKSIQKYEIVMPEIPKALFNLSDKISIIAKRPTFSVHNSVNASMKINRVMTEDEDVCMSEPQSNSDECIVQSKTEDKKQNININRIDKHDRIDRNDKNPVLELPIYDPKQIIRSRGNKNQLAFSFDENSNNSKQVKLGEDLQMHMLENSNLMIIRGFQEGKLSKIQERLNSKQVCESRQSLGEYLNISESRDRESESRDRHFNQDTQTLLIV